MLVYHMHVCVHGGYESWAAFELASAVGQLGVEEATHVIHGVCGDGVVLHTLYQTPPTCERAQCDYNRITYIRVLVNARLRRMSHHQDGKGEVRQMLLHILRDQCSEVCVPPCVM